MTMTKTIMTQDEMKDKKGKELDNSVRELAEDTANEGNREPVQNKEINFTATPIFTCEKIGHHTTPKITR